MNPETEKPQAETPTPAPQASAPVAISAEQQAKNKKLYILLGSIVGGVAVIAFIIWAVYAALFSVSKEDYREAVSVGNSIVRDASSSYSDVSQIAYISSYSTETQTKNNVESAKESLETYKAANTKFKDLKALRDSDVKKAYDAYIEKYDAFVAFSETYIASAEKALPAVLNCEKVATSTVSDIASFKAAIIPCQDALSGAKDVSDKDLKAFIAAYIENVDQVSKIVDEVASLSSSDYTRRSALRTQLYDETDKLQDAQKDANSNIEKRLKAVSPRDAYNELGNVLEEKQRK